MTIKEFCTEYGKSETNVRAKIAHNKDKLKDHVSKSPYTRTITIDDFAVSFLLEDRRSKGSSDESFERKSEEKVVPKGTMSNETADAFQNWNDAKKKRVMDICMEQVKNITGSLAIYLTASKPRSCADAPLKITAWHCNMFLSALLRKSCAILL